MIGKSPLEIKFSLGDFLLKWDYNFVKNHFKQTKSIIMKHAFLLLFFILIFAGCSKDEIVSLTTSENIFYLV